MPDTSKNTTPKPETYSEEFLRGYRKGLVAGLDEACSCEEPKPAISGAPAADDDEDE